jgi:alkylation response protein AidB-like acyl-CoA dehydrogenase
MGMETLGIEDWAALRADLGVILQQAARSKASRAESLETLASLGWLGVNAPDELGGMDQGAIGLVVLAEESAHSLSDLPLFGSIGLATTVALACQSYQLAEDLVAGRKTGTVGWACGVANERISRWDSLHAVSVIGDNQIRIALKGVPSADDVDYLLAPSMSDNGQADVWLVRLADARRSVYPQVDESRRVYEVDYDGPAERLASGAIARAAVTRMRHLGSLWVAAEAVGVARFSLELACAYARDRKQFGRAIGTFQGVSHVLADTYCDLELARSAVLRACRAIDQDEPDRDTAIQSALALALPTGIAAAERAIQVLGGIGMTWEHVAHRYYKRALALNTFDGPALAARSRLDIHSISASDRS